MQTVDACIGLHVHHCYSAYIDMLTHWSLNVIHFVLRKDCVGPLYLPWTQVDKDISIMWTPYSLMDVETINSAFKLTAHHQIQLCISIACVGAAMQS